MSAILLPPALEVPPLRNGEVLSRGEFLRRWERMPELRHAERIEGVVALMPSPVSLDGHAIPDNILGWALTNYAMATLGTASVGKATTLLDWSPVFTPDEAIAETVAWYRRRNRDSGRFDARALCFEQIANYAKRQSR